MCSANLFSKSVAQMNDFLFFNVSMPRLGAEAFFAAKLKQVDELLVEQLYYHTNLASQDLAVLDAYVAICQGKPVEAIDRLSSKEIDFYLRDDAKVASFAFYPSELYDILVVGEELKKIAFFKETQVKPHLDTSLYGEFFELSYGEQLELVEDVLGEYYFSKYPQLAGKLVCDQVDGKAIKFYLEVGDSAPESLKSDIVDLLRFHLQCRVQIFIKELNSHK